MLPFFFVKEQTANFLEKKKRNCLYFIDKNKKNKQNWNELPNDTIVCVQYSKTIEF